MSARLKLNLHGSHVCIIPCAPHQLLNRHLAIENEDISVKTPLPRPGKAPQRPRRLHTPGSGLACPLATGLRSSYHSLCHKPSAVSRRACPEPSKSMPEHFGKCMVLLPAQTESIRTRLAQMQVTCCTRPSRCCWAPALRPATAGGPAPLVASSQQAAPCPSAALSAYPPFRSACPPLVTNLLSHPKQHSRSLNLLGFTGNLDLSLILCLEEY